MNAKHKKSLETVEEPSPQDQIVSKAQTSQVNTPSPFGPIGSPVPEQHISKPAIIFAAVGSMIITALLATLYIWADYESETGSADSVAVSSVDPGIVILVVGIALLLVLLPGIIVALIVLPKLKKK